MYWIAFGDIHESFGVLGSIPGLGRAQGVILTGDLTNRGSRESADRVIDAVAAINPRIFALPGNMDTDAVEARLAQRGMDLHLRVRELAPGLGLMGVGYSTPTPFGTPGEVAEATLVGWLDATHALAASFATLIVAVHEPPHGSKADMLGNGEHVGSPGVRAFIERARPALVLTGHIHESRAVDRIGESTVINPGMLAGGGFVRIEYRDGALSAELMSV